MNTPIFSTAFLPPVSYMALLCQHEKVIVEQHETFPKQTYRNRCVIATANGPLTLSVPVVRSNHSTTREVGISYAEPWNIRLWRAIESAYNASPYFLYYGDGFRKILLERHESLLTLNNSLLEYSVKKLKVKTQITYSMDYTPQLAGISDYRTVFSPKHPQEGFPIAEYDQVFADRLGFLSDMSIVDLIFNLGPDSKQYLTELGSAMLEYYRRG